MAITKQPRLSADEKRWRAQRDVEILRDAALIKADRGRFTAAKSEATKTVKALNKALKAK